MKMRWKKINEILNSKKNMEKVTITNEWSL
jgi:hypothetical protein